MSKDKRFIEETFPVRDVSRESVKEKNIRHGHISTLHIWWARRPLASSRATSYAALVPAPKDGSELGRKKRFVVELCRWENSLNKEVIEQARREILEANGGRPPRVLDPFAGGGAIPLEALRLGCETYASDYNPVATLILKCTLEYPQKFGRKVKIKTNDLGKEKEINPLLEDVKRWGNRVLEEARREIGQFYPCDDDGSVPVGYIWARTIPCQNPTCGAEIPLMRQFWLARKSNKKVALCPYIEDGGVKFNIVGDGYEPMPGGFDPGRGTVARAVATCPVCGSAVDANTTRSLFQNGKAGQRMVAVVTHKGGEKGKRYRLAAEKDIEAFRAAERYLTEKREALKEQWGIDPVPDEPLRRVPVTFGVINVWVYGMNTWGDLFNSRQKLALITFAEKVRLAYQKMVEEGYDEDYAKAVVGYLGLGVNRLASYNTTNAPWHVTGEKATQIYGRQALPMVWDYAETNPFSESFSWNVQMNWISNVLSHLSQIPPVRVEEEDENEQER